TILRWPMESTSVRPVHRRARWMRERCPIGWLRISCKQVPWATKAISRPLVDPPGAGVRAMNLRIVIFNGTCLLSAFALVGCATPSKLQQAFSRNASNDIGQTRVTRKEKLAQDFDHARDDAQFNAAASSWERGDLEGCRKILEQLLDRNPNHPRARL